MTEAVNFNPAWFTDRLRQYQGFREMLHRERPQMLMLVESPPKRGKTWLLQQMAYQCRQEDPSVPVVYINLREPQIKRVDEFQFVQLLSESFRAPQYFGPLFVEVGRLSGDTAWLPTEPMQRLADEILVSFNTEALLIPLFRYVDASYDFSPGERGQEKTFQLVKFCLEKKTLPLLVDTLVDLRADRADVWTRMKDDIEQAIANAAPAELAGHRATLRATGQERERTMRVITDILVESLTQYLAQLDRLVLLIDSYEDCSFDAQRWLETSFLPRLSEEALKANLVLVVAGRRTPYIGDPAVRNLILRDPEHEENPEKYGLSLFSAEHIAEYIEKRNIDADWATLDGLSMVTDGNPNLLAMIYEQKLNS